jgi:P-type Ca2+ transporter type 2C
MFYTLSVENVLTTLTSSIKGLSNDAVQQRRGEYGFNELPTEKRSLIFMFLREFHDVMVYILLGALAFSIVMPFFESGGNVDLESFLDAFVILAILIVNAVLGFVQEYKAEEAIMMLKKLTSTTSRVRRDGQERIIQSRDLVPGDIIILESGDKVSADGRIIRCSHFQINESSLTGESQPVKKNTDVLQGDIPIADRRNMVYSGTLVAVGSAEVIVTAIGTHTEIGRIADMVAHTQVPETPLERRMKQLGKLLGIVVIGLCAMVIAIGIASGRSFMDTLLISVSLAVSAVPEGLPAVVTVCMALGVRRMVKENALVRRLEALEALGSVTVICADKTSCARCFFL